MRHLHLILILSAPAVAADPPRFVVENRTPPKFVVNDRTGCVCGPDCLCRPGACPGGCPLAPTGPAGVVRTNEGNLIRWTGAGWVFVGEPAFTPATGSAIDNRNPADNRGTPVAGALYYSPPVGGCAGGSCGLSYPARGVRRW